MATLEHIDIGVYYFPQYHPDERNDEWHGRGWTEWELVKRAEPRFPGHYQPKIPAWGYYDESQPEAAARAIDVARSHGVDFFIFDWYWYEDGPFLEQALRAGFLKARNAREVGIALMWANHNWENIHPVKVSEKPSVLANGSLSHQAFVEGTNHVIAEYFQLPQYYRLLGGAYFSFFDVMQLVQGLGGIEKAAVELDGFRERARAAGAGKLHLNAVVWGLENSMLRHQYVCVPPEVVTRLGFDSVTSYTWFQYVAMEGGLTMDYSAFAGDAAAGWQALRDAYPVPYIPNVTMGWDPSPRTVQSEEFRVMSYPFTPILVNNTPSAFGEAIRKACGFVRGGRGAKVLTVNAWNEWTEGSYLEPDERWGLQYLEAMAAGLGARL